MYFGGTVLRARAKPFWFDEILTLLAARQPTYAATVHAARDIDWTPPFTDLVGHIVHGFGGQRGNRVSRSVHDRILGILSMPVRIRR